MIYIDRALKNTTDILRTAEKLNPGSTISWKNMIANKNYYRLHKIRICKSLFNILSNEMKIDAAAVIQSYYQTVIKELSNMEEEQNIEQIEKEFYQFKEELNRKGIRTRDQAYYDDCIDYSQPNNSNYEEWCWNNHYLLNPMNEYPFRIRHYLNDDLEWHPGGIKEIRFNDIINTYKHARLLLFNNNRQPKDDTGCRNSDVETIENLQDCYVRLYSIIDKSAKILNMLYPDKDDPQQPFYKIVRKFKNDRNYYLRGLYEINQDLSYNPKYMKKQKELGTIDPFYSIKQIDNNPSFLRDMMAHAAVNIVGPEDNLEKYEKYKDSNIISMTPLDLKIETERLMGLIRELIMHVYLAVKQDKILNNKLKN